MPQLNRRRFLQAASAAGLVPALPASAAATAPCAMTSAQMLWAKLYANAGNAPNVTGLARAMGISSEAAQGVYAKLIQSNILAAPGVGGLSRAINPVQAGLNPTVIPKAPTTSLRTRLAKFNDARKAIVEEHFEEGFSEVTPDQAELREVAVEKE